MRVLLSTIGSRGDVQPLVALALQLKALGQEVRLCVPPDFRDWIESLGIPVTPIGPEVRNAAVASDRPRRRPPSPEQMRQVIEATVATQFETIAAAAQGCDVIVAATALQIAARLSGRSEWESLTSSPPTPRQFCHRHTTRHPRCARLDRRRRPQRLTTASSGPRSARRWNDTWGAALNSHRASAGLAPVSDVRSYMFTDRPWLAADPTLGALARSRGSVRVPDRRLDPAG